MEVCLDLVLNDFFLIQHCLSRFLFDYSSSRESLIGRQIHPGSVELLLDHLFDALRSHRHDHAQSGQLTARSDPVCRHPQSFLHSLQFLAFLQTLPLFPDLNLQRSSAHVWTWRSTTNCTSMRRRSLRKKWAKSKFTARTTTMIWR